MMNPGRECRMQCVATPLQRLLPAMAPASKTLPQAEVAELAAS